MTDTATSLPAPPGPASPRTDAGVRTSLRVLAVGLSLLAVGWGALTVASLLARVTVQSSATYEGVHAVDLDLAFESVQIVGVADATSVTMDRSYTWSLSKPSVGQRRDGDRLVITSSGCGFNPGLSCSGKVDLVVPEGTTVRVRTGNSGLTLRDLTGDIDAGTSNGSVQASNLSGQVDLGSSNGAIEASALRSDRVNAHTSNGSVRLSFDVAPTAATAGSSNGSVEVLVPRGGPPYRVTATTSNGTRDVAVPTDPSSLRTIEAHTSNGSVRVLERP
jgi:Putative adhesin